MKKNTPSHSTLPNASFHRWIYFSLFSSLNYLRANLIKPPGKSLVFEADSWSPIVFFLGIRPIRKQATRLSSNQGSSAKEFHPIKFHNVIIYARRHGKSESESRLNDDVIIYEIYYKEKIAPLERVTSYAQKVTRWLFAHHIGRWVVGGRALSHSPIGGRLFWTKQKIKKGALTARAHLVDLAWSLLLVAENHLIYLCCFK